MAKLHIYRKVGKVWTKTADGDGNIDDNNPFVVTITSGSVSSGQTYEIRQGQSPDGPLCDCTAVNGNAAMFNVSADNAVLAQHSDESQRAIANFQAALAAVSKTVIIEISNADLEFLKAANYALCFAKKVASGSGGGIYNVVWQSSVRYLSTTTFSWTPQYSLFGTNTFAGDVKVVAQTNQLAIGLGEKGILKSSGLLVGPSTGPSPTGVTMVNEYGTIHPALSQISTLNGATSVTPLYVAEQPIALGQATLTPKESVLVWFEQNIETSTMFSSARSMDTEIDLTFTNSQTRLYQDQKWVNPG
jgi:hypothetical protein